MVEKSMRADCRASISWRRSTKKMMKMIGIDFETAVRQKMPILTIVIDNAVLSEYLERRPPLVCCHDTTQLLQRLWAAMGSGLKTLTRSHLPSNGQ